MSRPYLERVVTGEERGLISWLIRVLLWPLSMVYRIGLAVYLGLYSLGIRKRYRLPVPVISVGNLTFGGTGKTPAVQEICRMLLEQGMRVVILSRGHGGSAKGSLIVSDGRTVLASASEAGDEPILLARTLPAVPVVVGKDRRASGDLACREFRPDVVLLDDGLQYWQLHRDLDIVVLDAERPLGSGFVMPMGDLREPASGLRRAGVVLANGLRPGQWLPQVPSDTMVLGAERAPTSLQRKDGGEIGLDWLRDRKVVAFCGIGKPESFAQTLRSLGASVVDLLEFPDHHTYTPEDVAKIEAARASRGAESVVTTEKDWVRLGERPPITDLYVLGIRLEIEGRERLAEHISERIHGARKAAAADEAAD